MFIWLLILVLKDRQQWYTGVSSRNNSSYLIQLRFNHFIKANLIFDGSRKIIHSIIYIF